MIGGFLFLIIAAAALYGMLPPARRKPASVALIGIGALMLGTNSLLSWNNIKLDDWILFTLLFGGMAVCGVGCLLHMKIKKGFKGGVKNPYI